jgi:alanyl-tRNA synthetase
VVLASVVDSKPAYTAAVTGSLAVAGYSARDILKEAAAHTGAGGAGGSNEFAQGGGRDASRVDDLLRAAVDIIRKKAEG